MSIFSIYDKDGFYNRTVSCHSSHIDAQLLEGETYIAGEKTTPTAPEPLEIKKGRKKKEIENRYGTVCRGGHYVDCNGYRMDAGADAASKMDAGVRLAEQLGQTSMTVRDFYNINRTVDLVIAQNIRNLQSADAHSHWLQKYTMVDAINVATTVAEVEGVDITFNISTTDVNTIVPSVMPIVVDKTQITANGVDVATITNIPEGASIYINGEYFDVADATGILELVSDTPLSFKIVTALHTHLDGEINVTAS